MGVKLGISLSEGRIESVFRKVLRKIFGCERDEKERTEENYIMKNS
jgi:hypothetical protein